MPTLPGMWIPSKTTSSATHLDVPGAGGYSLRDSFKT
uniref:Uncharacterized protein n=1 Tax=Anguilla anguilla TaxID=7936 RepID=A0A0E9XVG3_ANGAN